MINYLLDKSASGMTHPSLPEGPAALRKLEQLLVQGRLAITSVTILEMLYSARNHPAWQRAASEFDAYRRVEPDEAALARAVEIQGLLCARGYHRDISVPDLVVAATAERARLVVLHNDRDFELIAEVTGLPVQRITALE